MRILFLTLKTFSATGGIEKFNRCFSKALHENATVQGWEVTVFSAYDNLPGEEYIPARSFRGFKQHKRKFFVAALRQMRHADIIVFGHINLAPLILLACRFFPARKKICIAHGREVWGLLNKQQQVALHKCDRIWSVSRYTAGIMERVQQLPARQISLFPNTLDPFFANKMAVDVPDLRKRYGIGKEEKVILTVARLADTEKFKGYDLVLESLPAICEAVPGTRYVLCGKWDDTEKTRVLNLINALKLHNVVILTGFVEESELKAHYQMADLFVLPSKKEGFGIVFLEAVWSGLPVIAGNRDGSVEALLEGAVGTLVDPEQPAALRQAILHQLASPLSQEQKETNRQQVAANFGFEKFKERQAGLLIEPQRHNGTKGHEE